MRRQRRQRRHQERQHQPSEEAAQQMVREQTVASLKQVVEKVHLVQAARDATLTHPGQITAHKKGTRAQGRANGREA
eukprot:5846193-Pleurochrysis_carterae.AAC.1